MFAWLEPRREAHGDRRIIDTTLQIDTYMFKKIAVIGAGTMGSGIAGQIANAGHEVLLLDLPGDEKSNATRSVATDKTDATSKSDLPDSANAVTDAAVQRLLTSDPPALMDKDCAVRIHTGNTRDHFDQLAQADWIIEAVVERLDIKRDLYRQLDAVIPDNCVVTSNTSTIPIALLVEGMPASFQRRFAITHYFNPVRYMRLLELVRGAVTDSSVMDRLADFNDRELGKGVVVCNDTPGFLGNRVGVFALQVGIDEALRNGLPIESADALMGRPMGIPKTGVFGLYDLIGIDLMADVVRSLRSILPAEDAFHAVSAESDLINTMISAGFTGNKGGGGFYRSDSDNQRLARDLSSGAYRQVNAQQPVRAVDAANALNDQREPLVGLIQGDDAEAVFCRNVLGRVLGYAASLLGNVTDSPQAIDDAMKLGFNWLRGPFEMIDALGVSTVTDMLAATGAEVPTVLKDAKRFYQVDAGQLRVRMADGQFAAIDLPTDVVRLQLQRRTLEPVARNRAASLYSIEGDLRLVEFHSKANALTDESMQIVAQAAEDPGQGILVHNDAQHYSAGVNLNAFLSMIDAQDWSGIDAFLARFQQAVKALKYCPVPVVGAPSGLALGGGFEVLLHCDKLVVHSNCVLGLVEAGVGLVPAGGGIKETYLRWYSQTGDWEQAAWKTWMNIGYGATGSSPALAARLAYYRPDVDKSVMNRDRLYSTSVAQVRALANGYQTPAEPEVKLAGGDSLARMNQFMDDGIARGDFFPHDKRVAMQIASVMCSDDGQARTVSEEELYARERAAFIQLAQTPQTRERIHHLLHLGGALRN